MKTVVCKPGSDERGFALMMVLGFMVVSFLIISGVMYSTSNAALQNDRHQSYYSTQEAAAAAAELAVAGILTNVQAGGRLNVTVEAGSALEATMESLPEWAEYEFRAVVEGPNRSRPGLIWKYGPLQVTNDVYTVRTGARTLNLDVPIASVVEQEIQVAEIPLFSYMAYSEFDLSFVSIADNNITLNGRVHSNRDIYSYPSGNLIIAEHITAAGEIRDAQHPGELFHRTLGTMTYQREVDSQANTLRLSPGLADPYDLLTRIASLADFFVVVSNNDILVHDGFTAVSNQVWTNFITTNISFYDGRELRGVRATEIDVGEFSARFGSRRLIHLDDITPYSSETNGGFRLVNGAQLPSGGLSVVTTNVLYVKGDYNTLNRRPAMLAADAVTFLSGAWDDAFVGVGVAENATLNAAVVTGIVPSDGSAGVFDGGFFNAIRMLENWTGRTLTFRGAIATPFGSRHAAELWRGDYYQPPTTRAFSYETDFLNPLRLPRGTPMLHALIRGECVTLAPNVLF
jgi:hypothetical protein